MALRERALISVAVLLVGATLGRPCLGADATQAEQDLRPHALRPGGTLTVKPHKLETHESVFLRLDGPSQIDDLPVDPAKIDRGQFGIVLPKEMRQGKYSVRIVNGTGQTLYEAGKPLRILATEKPVITKVTPHPSFPAEGAYSFELIGENFGHEADESEIRINDQPIEFAARVNNIDRQATVQSCEDKWPCLIANRHSLKIYRLSLEKHALYRPLHVSVNVDSLGSEPTLLLLSKAQRSTPALLAFAVLFLLGGAVLLMARGRAAGYRPLRKRYPTLTYLFIDPPSNTYSLSRFQLILWTGAAILAFAYVGVSQSLIQGKLELPAIPEGLMPLLGLSIGTTALSVGATESHGSKGAGPPHPEIGDFINSGGILAPERMQFFLWTILGVLGFVGATLAQDPATISNPPKIPESFLPLMGVSSLGYLAGKVARKAGPVIKQLLPPPPYDPPASPPGEIVVVGTNLSPKAQVWVNGVQIPADAITVRPEQSAAAEFVTKLAVSTAAAAAAVRPAGVPSLKVVNPDGQSAEA